MRSGPDSLISENGAEAATPSPTFLDDGKNTIASQLVSRLREAIISGQLEAGSKINLDRAKQSFNVSLSPLREALARLISDGLVEFEDNRGYRVSPVSLSNLEEITSLREEFETYALRESTSPTRIGILSLKRSQTCRPRSVRLRWKKAKIIPPIAGKMMNQ